MYGGSILLDSHRCDVIEHQIIAFKIVGRGFIEGRMLDILDYNLFVGESIMLKRFVRGIDLGEKSLELFALRSGHAPHDYALSLVFHAG